MKTATASASTVTRIDGCVPLLRKDGVRYWKQVRIERSGGYIGVLCPGHPRAKAGHVLEHVLVAERALGKPLPAGAVVHHVNGDRKDNRPSNLVVCQGAGYHQLLHYRQRALTATGNANASRCRWCREWEIDMGTMLKPHTQWATHRQCKAEMNAHYRRAA